MGKATRNSRNEYIHNFARTCQGQLGIRSSSFYDYEEAESLAMDLHRRGILIRVSSHLENQDRGDDFYGRLACCGVGSARRPGSRMTIDLLGKINTDQDHWLSFFEDQDGFAAVRALAAYAVVAAMVDNILADNQKASEEDLYIDTELGKIQEQFDENLGVPRLKR